MKVDKSKVLRKGKKLFGTMLKFNTWLNSDIEALGCKPITLWETNQGIQTIYEELCRIEEGILS